MDNTTIQERQCYIFPKFAEIWLFGIKADNKTLQYIKGRMIEFKNTYTLEKEFTEEDIHQLNNITITSQVTETHNNYIGKQLGELIKELNRHYAGVRVSIVN